MVFQAPVPPYDQRSKMDGAQIEISDILIGSLSSIQCFVVLADFWKIFGRFLVDFW